MELLRVRSFYTKKLEAQQRKHQGQITALRRGVGGPAGEGNEGKRHMDGERERDRERQELQGRIMLLEGEVLRTAEELGRMRASALSSAASTTSTTHVSADTAGTSPIHRSSFDEKEKGRKGEQDQDQEQGREKETERETERLKEREDEEEMRELREENAQYRLDVKRLQREVRAHEKHISQLTAQRNCDVDTDSDTIESRKSKSQVNKTPLSSSPAPVLSSTQSSDVTIEHLQKELSDQADAITTMSADWNATKADLQRSIKVLKQDKAELQAKVAELQQSLLDKGGEVQHWQGQALKLELITQQAKTPQMQQYLVLLLVLLLHVICCHVW